MSDEEECTYFGMAAEVIGRTLTPTSSGLPKMWRIKISIGLCLNSPERQQLDIWLPCIWAGVRPLYEHINRICEQNLWKLLECHVMDTIHHHHHPCLLARVGSKVSIFYRIKVTTDLLNYVINAYHKSWQRSTPSSSRTRSKIPSPCLCPGSCIHHIYTNKTSLLD